MMGIPLTLAWVAEQPWALRPETMALMKAILMRRDAGVRLSAEEIEERTASAGQHPNHYEAALYDCEDPCVLPPLALAATAGRPQGSLIAVIPVLGIISQRAQMVDDLSGPGGTSVEKLTQRFRAVLADPAVKAIVLDVDSPGGGVYGVQELAAEILASRGQKPIVAVANSLAASAAYWIASAADEVSVVPSGEVGSIGVYAAHEDISAMLEKDGVKVTLISAGEFKTEGNPFEPLSAEAVAYMKSRIDDYHAAFVNAVAKGRGVPTAKVRKEYGQGRTKGAVAAKAAGMVDRIETLDQAIRRVAGKKAAAEPVAAEAVVPPAVAIDHSAEYEAAMAKARVL